MRYAATPLTGDFVNHMDSRGLAWMREAEM